MSDWTDYHQQSAYTGLGLTNEAGEVTGEVKKLLRDDDGQLTADRRTKLIDECGDVLWYLARVLEGVDATLEDAADANLTKVHRRLTDGTLTGSGER